MVSFRYISVETPVGLFHFIIDSGERVVVSGFGDIENLARRISGYSSEFSMSVARGHEYEKFIRQYFSGELKELSFIPRIDYGSEFQRLVWRSIESIDYGNVATYKEVAETIQNPGSVRAIGSTCGSNKHILLVPCHRVVRSDGGMGEYAYGRSIKRFLLELEGVDWLSD